MVWGVNIKSLKRSENPRHHVIYDRRLEFLSREQVVDGVTDQLVEDLSLQFPTLEIQRIMGGGLLIKSKGDV